MCEFFCQKSILQKGYNVWVLLFYGVGDRLRIILNRFSIGIIIVERSPRFFRTVSNTSLVAKCLIRSFDPSVIEIHRFIVRKHFPKLKD